MERREPKSNGSPPRSAAGRFVELDSGHSCAAQDAELKSWLAQPENAAALARCAALWH